MNENDFRKYLKQKGKKPHVVDRNIAGIKQFMSFVEEELGKNFEDVSKEDIGLYVKKIEAAKKSAKGPLYVLLNYFLFCDNEELFVYAHNLRLERTKKSRRVFPLKKLLGIDQVYIKRLAEVGIKDVKQMLEAGKLRKQRVELSQKLAIPQDVLLEIVKLSDLARMPYVRAKLTRLYYEAGLDSPDKVAAYEPKELHAFFVKFVEESSWDGMVPNPKDLVGNIREAKKLEPIVEE